MLCHLPVINILLWLIFVLNFVIGKFIRENHTYVSLLWFQEFNGGLWGTHVPDSSSSSLFYPWLIKFFELILVELSSLSPEDAWKIYWVRCSKRLKIVMLKDELMGSNERQEKDSILVKSQSLEFPRAPLLSSVYYKEADSGALVYSFMWCFSSSAPYLKLFSWNRWKGGHISVSLDRWLQVPWLSVLNARHTAYGWRLCRGDPGLGSADDLSALWLLLVSLLMGWGLNCLT